MIDTVDANSTVRVPGEPANVQRDDFTVKVLVAPAHHLLKRFVDG